MLKVLYICTANICRSPSAAATLVAAGVPGVEVRSAGVAASTGAPGCSMAPALKGRSHQSQPLTPELIEWADLILTADRGHQAATLAMDPGARTRTFTIRHAGRLAQWLLEAGMLNAARGGASFEEGDPRNLVTPLPVEVEARGEWLVAELDAARGMAPVTQPEPQSRRRRRSATEDLHPDDIPDPHVLGAVWHGPAAQQIAESTAPLIAVLREVQR